MILFHIFPGCYTLFSCATGRSCRSFMGPAFRNFAEYRGDHEERRAACLGKLTITHPFQYLPHLHVSAWEVNEKYGPFNSVPRPKSKTLSPKCEQPSFPLSGTYLRIPLNRMMNCFPSSCGLPLSHGGREPCKCSISLKA